MKFFSFFNNTMKVNNLKLFTNFKDILKFKFLIFNRNLNSYNTARKLFFSKEIKFIYYKYLFLLYKFNNKYYSYSAIFKESPAISFLNKLKNLLGRLLNKKIILNIINLKSLGYNSDIFTKILALKFKRKHINVV